MKKLFGMLVAVLIVFSLAGSASAKPFNHCDGKEWDRSERMPIDIGDLRGFVGAICSELKSFEKKHKKENSNGFGSCDFRPIFNADCGRPELRLCRTRTSCKPVPEPATMLLFGAGLAGLGVFRKKFKKA